MYKFTEARKHVRVEKPFITRFHVKLNENMVSSNWDMVAVINLSAGGLFFYVKKDLEVGTILDLKIGFSIFQPSLICVGKIIRAKRHLDTSTVGYAIEFTKIDEDIKEMITDAATKSVKSTQSCL